MSLPIFPTWFISIHRMQKKSLLIIFFVIFIDLLGFGIVIPILPYYATSFGATATNLGWLMMCYSAMQFLFSPFWGALSDRIGRRPVILTCLIGIGGSLFLLGMAKSLAGLFIARLLGGFFGANISAATAYIADTTTPQNRTKGMGIIGAAFGLGFLFGPALGGVLSRTSYSFPALVASGIAGLNFIFAFFFLKEPRLSERERSTHRSHLSLFSIRQTLQKQKVAWLIFLFFLTTLGIAQLETAFALFLLKRFNLDAYHAGLVLAFVALVMVFIQGGAIGPLVKKFGEKNLIRGGALLMAVGLALVSFSFLFKLSLVGFFIHALGYAVVNPSLSGLVSSQATGDVQGSTMGVYHSAGSLGRILGPLLAGRLFDSFGEAYPFLVACCFFMMVAFFASVKLSQR